MKYNYRKSLTYAQWISVVFFLLFLLFVCSLLGVKKTTLLKAGIGALFLIIVHYVRFSHEMLNRYVELQEDHIYLNSFRFRDVKLKPAVSLNIKFEDIWSIEAKRLPLIGIWAISVEGRNLPHKVTLSFCFDKHRELTQNLCRYVKRYNPKSYIDPCLKEYLDR